LAAYLHSRCYCSCLIKRRRRSYWKSQPLEVIGGETEYQAGDSMGILLAAMKSQSWGIFFFFFESTDRKVQGPPGFQDTYTCSHGLLQRGLSGERVPTTVIVYGRLSALCHARRSFGAAGFFRTAHDGQVVPFPRPTGGGDGGDRLGFSECPRMSSYSYGRGIF
jgi:hypothetical protein